jgi:enoyl-CoA hydratase
LLLPLASMPHAAIEILRQRLTPAAFVRAATMSEVFTPANAVESGFVDEIVEPAELMTAARAVAARLSTLPRQAYLGTKRRARSALAAALHTAIATDAAELNELF